MEKNRIRPMKSGKSSRMSYSRQKEVLQMPNLIEVQKDSYDWFLKSGLKEAFEDISPITDYSGTCHQRQISHKDLMLVNLIRLLIMKSYSDFQRCCISCITISTLINAVFHIIFTQCQINKLQA